jgi:hypothetical protein
MNQAKEILLAELNEQGHPEKVEDVIFWVLEHYAKSEPRHGCYLWMQKEVNQ